MQYALGGAGHMTSASVQTTRPVTPTTPQHSAMPQELSSLTGSARLEFNKFRPLFGAAMAQERVLAVRADFAAKLFVAKFALTQSLNPSAPAPDPSVRDQLAQLVADITFPERSRGHALTFTLAMAILSRTPESFSAENQHEFASLLGAELFPWNLDGKRLVKEWILGILDKSGEESLKKLFATRASEIKRFAGTNVWHIEQQQ
jgi:hypothetical protein